MVGSHESKYELTGARVYIHLPTQSDGTTVTHIDVEHPDLNQIIKPGENSFVGGKAGGIFIGLKASMIERARDYVTQGS